MTRCILKYLGLYCLLLSPFLYGGWLPPVEVYSSSTQTPSRPLVAVDSHGNTTALWPMTNGSYASLWAATKQYGESSWSSAQQVSLSGQNVSSSTGYILVVDSEGNATAVWHVGNEDVPGPIQSSTKPYGGTWGEATSIFPVGEAGVFWINAVEFAGNVTVLWVREDGVLKSSTKLSGYSDWESPVTISSPGSIGTSYLATASIVDAAGNITGFWFYSEAGEYYLQSATRLFGHTEWHTASNPVCDMGSYVDFSGILPTVDFAGNVTVLCVKNEGTGYNLMASTKPLKSTTWPTTPTLISSEESILGVGIVADSFGNVTALWGVFPPFTNRVATKQYGEESWQPPQNLPYQNSTVFQPFIDRSDNITAIALGGLDGDSLSIQAWTKPNGGSWQPFVTISPGDNPAMAIDPAGNITAVWSMVEGSTKYIKSATNEKPSPPPHFQGEVKKRKGHHRKHPYRLTAKWRTSPSTNIESYRVYKRSKVVQTLPAHSKRLFRDHLRWENSTKKYSIVAVGADAIESAHTKLKVRH